MIVQQLFLPFLPFLGAGNLHIISFREPTDAAPRAEISVFEIYLCFSDEVISREKVVVIYLNS